jgi:hypothetical protein
MALSPLEIQVTKDTVREFVRVSQLEHEGYAYAAGYLESMVAELIKQLPQAKRSRYRIQFQNDTIRMLQNHNSRNPKVD